MHRSGTSAVTRVINLLGADISTDLMPPVTGNNERGFWESISIAAIHDRLLAALHSAWDDVFLLPPNWIETDAAWQAQEELSHQLEANFANSRVFVVKDPRLARLLPLWLELLDKRRIEPVIVIPFRNPLEVALSLKARDGFSLAKSMLIYAQSNLDAERASRRRPRLFVPYDEFLSDWRTLAKRLKKANVGFRIPSRKTVLQIERFLSADLRHGRATRRDLTEHSEMPDSVIEIYDRLTEVAKGAPESTLAATFDRVRRPLSEATKLFGAASLTDQASGTAILTAIEQSTVSPPQIKSAVGDALHQETSKTLRASEDSISSAAANRADPAMIHALQLMADTRSDLARRLDEASAHAGNLEEIRVGLAKELAAAAANAAHAANQIAALESARADLNRQLTEERARFAEMSKERSAFEQRIEELRMQLPDLLSRAETAEALTKRGESRIESLIGELDEARTRGTDALASQAALQSQVGEVRSEAKRFATQIQEAQAQGQRLTSQIDALTTELETLRAERVEDERQLQQHVAQSESLSRELEAARAAAAGAEARLQQLASQLESLTQDLEAARTAAAEAEARLQQQASRSESLSSALEVARAAAIQAEARLQQQALQLEPLTRNLETMRAGAVDAEERVQQQASQLERLTRELDAARAKVDEAKSEAEASGLRAQASEARAQEQAAKLITATSELEAARIGASELLVARDAHQGQAETAQTELAQLAQKAKESEALNQQQALQLRALTKDLREARTGTDNLVAARDGLRQQLDKAEHASRRLELRTQEAELRSQIQALKLEVVTGSLLERRERAQPLSPSHPRPQAEGPSSAAERTATVIRDSGLFDPDHYQQRAECAGRDPVVHYLTVGEKSGISPSTSFNPAYYADRYPDVAAAGICLLEHYVLHGKKEGRRARPVAEDFVEDPSRFAPDKATILLVSHEASRTGAPILALAIGQLLSAKYNIISLLLRPGDIIENFESISSRIIYLEEQYRSPIEFKYAVASILERHPIRYAIVSSIESRDVVPTLARSFIPTINMIHEFSPYTRPLRSVREALGWTTELVFSANLTADSFRKEHQALQHRKIHIIPQGRCSLPVATSEATLAAELNTIKSAMRPAGYDKAFVVLGVGTVHLRKGIDLFITTASAAVRMAAGKRQIRFVWIGHGYDPEADMSYSVYLAEQIARSGLQDHVVMLDPVSELEPAYAMADALYLSSRLDPLPNVTIDAAFRGLPVICFEDATGMAEILKQDKTAATTVLPYLDVDAAAHRIVELANDEPLRKRIGESTRALALRTFEIESYARQIDDIGGLAVERMKQRSADYETIVADPLFDPNIFTPPNAPATTREDEILRFLAYWSAARTAPRQLDHIDLRRPCAGFNPQIYAQHHPEILEADVNPLADYIRKGRPGGPWVHETIGPDLDKAKLGSQTGLRVGIQAHFHYPELIEEFLECIAPNKASFDLLLTTNDAAKAEILGARTTQFNRGIVKIRIVPNRGRDIAPLLTALGREIVRDYDVIGHVHGKRSTGVDAAMGETWREFLWQHLLGPRYPMMDIALAHFAENEKLGLLFPEEPHLCDWDANLEIADDLARGAGLERPLPPFFEFPVGTMFWARTFALAPLVELALTWEHYPEEPISNDGTVLHALERLLPFSARKREYSYATLHIPGISR